MSLVPATEAAPPIDLDLLRGLSFRCRDDCGLCCFAEPLVRTAEAERLLIIAPETEFAGSERTRFLAARPNGGACQFLQGLRCRVHTDRPSPCREFPLTVHVGTRLQATAVLSCPGLDLAFLEGPSGAPDRSPRGLDSEIAQLAARSGPAAGRRVDAARRRRSRIVRRLAREGRWVEEEFVRDELRREIPFPSTDDYPAADPPSADGGLETLPLFFDGRAGPVALAEGLGGWELLELRVEGGVERTLDAIPPPRSPPPVTDDGRRVLEGYLGHWLARDALFGAVHLGMVDGSDGSVTDWVRDELRSIGALTLARADVRVRARHGGPRSLGAAEVRDGIRATDQDLLDRPSWGERL